MKIVFFTFYVFPNASKIDYMRVQESHFFIMTVLTILAVASCFVGYLAHDFFIGWGTSF
jgi:hypothetical protein